MARRVLVIGLDCATPELVFDHFRDDLPNLKRLMESGTFGPLETVIPPITVPAWSCMMTGYDPGHVGYYGFRNRADYSYNRLAFVTSDALRDPTVWDLLGQHGKRSIVVGFPPSYPPKPILGCLVTDFLTPNAGVDFTYPPELKGELARLVGEYLFDVKEFRTTEKRRVVDQVYEMTRQRFTVMRYLLTHKPWEFAFFVEMGVDRLQHGFWQYHDPQHVLHDPDPAWREVLREYYRFLDAQIGTLLAVLDGETTVFVVSDHGAKRMDGGVCVNEWLMREGYLTLHNRPAVVTRFEDLAVDWARTKVWGDGGYYARLFVNVKGREPQGVVRQEEYESLRSELITKLEALGDEQGRPIGTKVYRPQTLYKEVRGIAPDLIALFGDLHWRSVGSVGHRSVWTRVNDTGPDGANHAMHGICIVSGPESARLPKPLGAAQVIDLAPTLLELYGVHAPSDLHGHSLLRAAR